jgi:pilus assembly protein CpaB
MRRGRILILIGLILAIGTAAAVYVVVQGFEQAQTTEVEFEQVVVARQPIAEEEPIEGLVGLADMPKDYVPQGALRSLEGTEELIAAGPIPQNAVIHPSMLISRAELAQEGALGKLVEQGLLAVAFPINELSSVSYGIRPGDHIDVLMTFSFMDIDQETQVTEPICAPFCPDGQTQASLGAQIPRAAAQLTLQNVQILGVGRWAQEMTAEQEQAQAQSGEPVQVELPQYITLMVTPQDALTLKLARELGAKIDLAVRSEEDAQTFTTQQVTLDYIMARFGVTLPARQPYTLESLAAGAASEE